jgi:hypothetical protein
MSNKKWIKSSHSGGEGGQCLEWDPAAAQSGTVPVRDSKDPEKGILSLSAEAWSSFVPFAQGHSI